MIKKLVFGTFLILLFAKIYALELEYFQCPNESSALKCSSNCVLYGSIKISLNLENDKNNVLLEMKDQNNTITETLKNCNVKDIANWSCSLNEIFSNSKHSVAKGKYFSSLSYRMLDGTDDNRFTCAVN